MKKKEKAPKSEYVTKSDLQEFAKSLVEALQKKDQKEPVTADKKIEAVADKPDAEPIPAKYRAIVDELLGSEFGVNISYPDSGGFLFKIIVPMELSNASTAHKEFYKCDIRTKSIPHSEGLGGVRKYVEKVANNLKI